MQYCSWNPHISKIKFVPLAIGLPDSVPDHIFREIEYIFMVADLICLWYFGTGLENKYRLRNHRA